MNGINYRILFGKKKITIKIKKKKIIIFKIKKKKIMYNTNN